MNHMCQGKEQLRLRREGVSVDRWRRNLMDEEQMRTTEGHDLKGRKRSKIQQKIITSVLTCL